MTPADCSFLIAQSSAARDPTRLLIVIGLLIVTVLAFGLIVLELRKRLLTKDRDSHAPALLMDDLRAMHKRGEISEPEYQRMRQRLIEKLAGSSDPGLSDRAPSAREPMNSPTRIGRASHDRPHPPNPKFDLTGDRLPDPSPEPPHAAQDGRDPEPPA